MFIAFMGVKEASCCEDFTAIFAWEGEAMDMGLYVYVKVTF